MEREVERKQTELINELKNNKVFNREVYGRLKKNIEEISIPITEKQKKPIIETKFVTETNNIVGTCYIGNNRCQKIPHRIKLNDAHCVETSSGFIELNQKIYFPGEIEISDWIDERICEKYRSFLCSDNLVQQYGSDVLKNYYISEDGKIIKVKQNKKTISMRYISTFKINCEILDSRMYLYIIDNKVKHQIPVAKILANVYSQVLRNNHYYSVQELHTHHIDGNRTNDTLGNIIVVPNEYHRVVEASPNNFIFRCDNNYREDVQKLLKVLRIHLINKQPLY